MRIAHVATAAIIAALLFGCATARENGSHPPKSRELATRPHVIDRTPKHEEPRLDPDNPTRTAIDLIAWASTSTLRERERVRGAIQQIGGNEAIVRALCGEAFAAQQTDHSRALIALAVIGETKSDTGERCLTEFVRLPFPTNGHVVEGEIIEQTALATLQAKAVDGLAYRMTVTGDGEVVRLAREHPSRIVRAEAISAYLWNRGDSEQAKAALAAVIRPDEKVFLDRVRRVSDDTAATFNAKLADFLNKHPELQPPPPERASDTGGASIPTDCDLSPVNQRAPVRGPKGE